MKFSVLTGCRFYQHPVVARLGLALALQPLFERVIRRWFHDTWIEDAPMRVRRWKVWKLGFRDFRGLDYVNEKTAKPEGAAQGLGRLLEDTADEGRELAAHALL